MTQQPHSSHTACWTGHKASPRSQPSPGHLHMCYQVGITLYVHP